MPKYVAKQDVDKGLVDPKKSLQEQPEYKQKMDKETEQRKKKFHQEKQEEGFHHKEGEKKKPRRERQRVQYDWNKKNITLQTKIPAKPKKILEKPNKNTFNDQVNKLKDERQNYYQQRKALIDQKKSIIKDLQEKKTTGNVAINQYTGEMKELMNQEILLRKEIKQLDNHKVKIYDEQSFLKDKISKHNHQDGQSIEGIKKKIQDKQHRLTTANIDKKQEAILHKQIQQLQRAITKAKPQIQIQTEVSKLKDHLGLLYEELKPIKSQLTLKIGQANQLKGQIEVMKKENEKQRGDVKQFKSAEDINKEYDEKIQAIEKKKEEVNDRIDQAYKKFHSDYDSYEDQQDLLAYIHYIESHMERVKEQLEKQAIRKKEQEQYEKKKAKERELRKQKQEAWKKREEERKKEEELRKIELEREREQFINRSPNHHQINVCKVLIDYCENLKPSKKIALAAKNAVKTQNLQIGKQWEKEMKSGASIIKSKKSNLDEEVVRKKVQKKVEKAENSEKTQQKPKVENFKHGFEIISRFQQIKMLPPFNQQEIDKSIKEIEERLKIYSNPSEEEAATFKAKAAEEFDQRNAFKEDHKERRGEQREHKTKNFRERKEGQKYDHKEEHKENKEQKKQYVKHSTKKTKISENDFPEIN